VCGNDILALGALFEASALGIRVPDALSITGFDDLDFASEMTPAITTVHVPAAEMGMRAADQLVASASRGTAIPPLVELEAPIVLRDTTAPPLH
jgi:LacI family transcriptional regulator